MFLRFWIDADVEHDLLTGVGRGGVGETASAVVDDVDAGGIHAEQRNYLALGECRDGDDGVGAPGGIARLFGEARPEFRSGVFARHHEEIVEGGDGAAERQAGKPLIEAVEEGSAAGENRFEQETAARVGRE